MLYHHVLSISPPQMYKLKEKGLVEVESNHITDKGKEVLFKYLREGNLADPILMLNILYVYSTGSSGGRIDVRQIRNAWRIMKEDVK